MTIKTIVFGFVAALISLQAIPASGQEACGERAKFMTNLANNFNEQPVAMGLTNKGAVIEVFSSNKSGSWTFLVTMPSGITCVVASGSGWELLKIKIAGEDS